MIGTNKKYYLLIFFCFVLPWIVFYFFIIFFREIIIAGNDSIWQRIVKYPQHFHFWLNFLPGIMMFIPGIIINFFINYFHSKAKDKLLYKLIILLFILVCIDQLVQLYIVMYHDSIYISVIKDWLEISPKSMIQNNNEFLSIAQIPSFIHFFVYFICILSGVFLFLLLNHFYIVKSHLYLSIIFYVSGFICSLFDKIIYNYGYDYIYINKLIIFDIKDIYIFIGVSLFFQSVGMNIDVLKRITEKDVLKYIRIRRKRSNETPCD
jgi:hypothetical protein